MISRREFFHLAAATAAVAGTTLPFSRLMAQQKTDQASLLDFESMGQVTLLHFTDMHAQLTPVYFREPSVNIGVGEVEGLPPHITGKDFLGHFGIKPGTPEAYALSSHDFTALAREYGRVGGVDRMMTLVKAVRADGPPLEVEPARGSIGVAGAGPYTYQTNPQSGQ